MFRPLMGTGREADMGGFGKRPRLSLVIPAYNEAAVIAQAVSEAQTALRELVTEFEIVVVDDGSTDGTATVVEKLVPQVPQTRLLRHNVNRGYGAALRSGFLASRYELVAFTDADCQFHLIELGKLLVLARQYPVVVGCRVDRKDRWQRRFLSWGYNQLVRFLLKTQIRDVDCALKVFHRELLLEVLPESRGFFVNTEIICRARRLGFPVAEVRVAHRPRAQGESKVSLWDVPRTIRTLLAFWFCEAIANRRQPPIRSGVFQTRVVVPEASEPAAIPLPVSSRGLPIEPPAPRQEAA